MAYPAYAHSALNVGGLVAGSIATGSALVGLAVFGPEAMETVAEELTNAATDIRTGSDTAFMDSVLNEQAATTTAGWANGVVSFLETVQTAAANVGVFVVNGIGSIIETVTNWAITDEAKHISNPLQGAVDWLQAGAEANEAATAPTLDSAEFWKEKAAAYVGAGAAHGAYKKLDGKSWVESVTAATPGVNLVR